MFGDKFLALFCKKRLSVLGWSPTLRFCGVADFDRFGREPRGNAGLGH